MRNARIRVTGALIGVAAMTTVLVPAAGAHPDDGEGHGHLDGGGELERPAASAELDHHDAATAGMVVSDGPSAKVTKNLAVAGRGDRLLFDGTTDVWAHDAHAYLGTYNDPCGTGEGFVAGGAVELIDDRSAPGIVIFDVRNPTDPRYVGNLPSVAGSRTNDVKVASMNSGDVLVHSNESCGGGPGGFEVYDVDDPTRPVHLASVRIDELNDIADSLFGGLSDVGVHNLWLFAQGTRDYVGVVSEGAFDNFRIYDITDPTAPTLATGWGAEEIFDPGVGDETSDVDRVLDAALWLLDGFGGSQNRFLHDVTVSDDGTKAYLSNWDAGLVLLDVSDPTDPRFVSTAIDLAHGSLDGELNSHSAWPNADGTVVVEGEEDFNAWERLAPPGSLTMDSPNTPGDPRIPGTAISTAAGDDFEASQTGNTGTVDGSSVAVDTGPLAGNTYAAIELATAAGSPTFADTGPLTGELVFIGRACAGDTVLNGAAVDPGDIAVVRRGACTFEEKADTAADAGAAAVVIANNATTNTPWSGLRIWDYSDPANPVLASTFDTTCSAASVPIEGCALDGTYSSHNVVVDGDRAYVSWYWDGVVVIDISDPHNPVEVARYRHDGGPQDGMPQDVWGIYKAPNSPWIYASDRNGGLYVLKEYGAGSAGSS